MPVYSIFQSSDMKRPDFELAYKNGWIRNERYKMRWFQVVGQEKSAIGWLEIETKLDGEVLSIFSELTMDGDKRKKMISVSKCDANSLKPKYHFSKKPKREIELHFGQRIKGLEVYGPNKIRNHIDIKATKACYDGAIKMQLIQWLPIKSGDKFSIPLFSYNDNKGRLINLKVLKSESLSLSDVEKGGELISITSTDGSDAHQSFSESLMNKNNRKLIAMKSVFGDRATVFERV